MYSKKNGNFQDAVLNYDEETSTFTSDQILSINGSAEAFDPYLTYENILIEKIEELAATPATPAVTVFSATGSYPYAGFDIPAVDTEGNDIISSKLFYTIWVEKDGQEQPLTLAASLYKNLEEDITDIPYTLDDSYDIYAGGARVYLNQSAEEIASWTKIGVQSVYYGGDEINKSDIAWKAIAKVGTALFATFVPTTDVDFTGNNVEAFAATFDGQYVQLAPVTEVPAGTAVILKADEAGSYLVETTTDAVLDASNELVAATEDVTADGTQYILAEVEDEVGFYQATEGTAIAAGKGYLVIKDAADIKAFYPFADDATGIDMVDGQSSMFNGEPVYNLAGQRISKMQKGINIVNGKKILF